MILLACKVRRYRHSLTAVVPVVEVSFKKTGSCVKYSHLHRKVMTYVFVIDQFHELEFPVGPLGMGHILEGPAQFLYGYVLLSHTVICSTRKGIKDIIRLIAMRRQRNQLKHFTLSMNGTLFVIVDIPFTHTVVVITQFVTDEISSR